MTDALVEFEKGDRVRSTRTDRVGTVVFVNHVDHAFLVDVVWDDDGKADLAAPLHLRKLNAIELLADLAKPK